MIRRNPDSCAICHYIKLWIHINSWIAIFVVWRKTVFSWIHKSVDPLLYIISTYMLTNIHWIIIHDLILSMKSGISWKVVYHKKWYTMKSDIPWKVIYHEKWYTMKSDIPWKVKYHEKWYTMKSGIPWIIRI